ncbi:uncharacterized protein F5Z01DRAFT_639929 [Emericellopsis atlantica]|uniref:Uncharacterized protein n=1 Tax=Emericellopsis atlantica TaxID=2614577 RepID=A0A9P7ZF78_9HYPO|nr:uncharacterized protein F5Z01DRAFT_639929 [Emericellopsis atlantica]KAG9250841.1 hypothetical protein F5Z01DRAFT_639929 [Emericellopsis atlantica]
MAGAGCVALLIVSCQSTALLSVQKDGIASRAVKGDRTILLSRPHVAFVMSCLQKSMANLAMAASSEPEALKNPARPVRGGVELSYLSLLSSSLNNSDTAPTREQTMPADRDSQYCRAGYSQAIADAVVHLDQAPKAPKRLNVRFHGANTDRARKTRATRDEIIYEEGSDSDDILSIHDALRSPRPGPNERTGQPASTTVGRGKAGTPMEPRRSSGRGGCWRFLLGVALGMAVCVVVVVVAVAKQDHHCVMTWVRVKEDSTDLADTFMERARAVVGKGAWASVQRLWN